MSDIKQKCDKCGYMISGEMYGAGDGTGEIYICSGCFWETKYDNLKLETINMKQRISDLYNSL